MSVLQHDLTKGAILRQLLVFSLPLLCANLLQLLYGMVGMLVVSRIVGSTGLAAVSNGSRLGFLISAFDSFALGVECANIALCNSLLDAVVAKLALSWLAAVVLDMGYSGIYVGQALSPLIPAFVGLVFYHRGKWMNGMTNDVK